jgi:ParB family transcriptional regulator, chromosome partitioning protein
MDENQFSSIVNPPSEDTPVAAAPAVEPEAQPVQPKAEEPQPEPAKEVEPEVVAQKVTPPPDNLPAINLAEISIDLIKPNPWQPRKVFNEETLQELSNSIKEHGILQPLVVVPMPDGTYQLIVGERRLRASKLAGLTKVPVLIRD